VQDIGYEIRVERRGQSAGLVDAGVPPIALPKDLESAIEQFSSMSSSFDQLEIIELPLR